jgi:hypothetical protein
MKTTEKHKLVNNPVFFSNRRTEALDDALQIFLETFEEYAVKNELTNEQIDSFKELILESYLERKASYFLENKFVNFSDYIDKAIQFAMKKSFQNNDKENITKVFYYNNKHRLISNEQY